MYHITLHICVILLYICHDICHYVNICYYFNNSFIKTLTKIPDRYYFSDVGTLFCYILLH